MTKELKTNLRCLGGLENFQAALILTEVQTACLVGITWMFSDKARNRTNQVIST